MSRFCSGFSLFVTLVIASQLPSLEANNAVPVLMWGSGVSDPKSEKHSINPFQKTTRKEFETFLNEKLEKFPPVITYIVGTLCVEDLIKHKEILQSTINDDSFYYLPAVEDALDIVEDLPYNDTMGDFLDFIPSGGMITLNVGENDYPFIARTYKMFKETTPNLTGIITGIECYYRQSERIKREAPQDENTTAFVVVSDRVVFYASQALTLKAPEDKNPIQLPLKPTVSEEESSGNIILTMAFTSNDSSAFKHQLLFKFDNKPAGYYSLKTVVYKRVYQQTTTYNLTTNTNIVFPTTFSYHCSQNINFQYNDSHVLNIQDLQVQIFPDAKSRKLSFSDAYDCIGFTTIPIWTGIFVTIILGLIMIWGLTMIMDIRTMDRFDDPKGKTINVSAQE